MIPGISALNHIAIRTAHVERMVRFYVDVLGLRELYRLSNEAGQLRLVYLMVSETQFIELFPDADDTPRGGHHAGGVNHLALEIEDVDLALAEAERLGVPILQPLKEGADGNRQLWIADPDGNRIEFMQMRPDCRQYQAIRALKEGRVSAAGEPASR